MRVYFFHPRSQSVITSKTFEISNRKKKKKKDKQEKLTVALQYFAVGDPKFTFLFRKKS